MLILCSVIAIEESFSKVAIHNWTELHANTIARPDATRVTESRSQFV